ncbi:MAG: type II secretion system F family protein [Rhodoluna sp.]
MPVAIALLIYELTRIPAFAWSLAVGVLAIALEILDTRARKRRKQIALVWPEVLDSLVSASSSGLTIAEAIEDLCTQGPEILKPFWGSVIARLDSGSTIGNSLVELQAEVGEVHADRLVALIQIVSDAGGRGFHEALRQQVKIARDDLALTGELESKQGWVSGTAKVAIAAPWLIVAMLSTRSENADTYASVGGSMVLTVGLLVSTFAYQLIRILARGHQTPRVFAR